MSPNEEVTTLASAVVFFAIAVLAALKRTEGPLTQPLGLMALLLFAYCLADVAMQFDPSRRWAAIANGSASFAGAAALSLVAGFMGLRARLRGLLLPLYGYFILLGLLCLVLFIAPASEHYFSEAMWAVGMLIGMSVGVPVLGWHLWQHAQRSPPVERARCHLLGSAFALGFGSVTVDLAALAGAPLPRLAWLGLAATGVVLAAMVLATRQLFARVTTVWAVAIVLLALTAVAGQRVAVGLSQGRTGLAVFGTVLVIGLFMVAIWPAIMKLRSRAVRRRYHMTLGRWTDHVRHNVLNPLAAMKGAAQMNINAHARGEPIDPGQLQLIANKVDQLDRLIRNFERLARGQPERRDIDLNAMLRNVAQSFEAATALNVRLDLDSRLPAVKADYDLLIAAFENLARNAEEAMTDGGELTLRTIARNTPLGSRVVIQFEDEGHGIDPRVLEDVFEPGVSTRSDKGRGLGLAYVREVVEAHGGTVTAWSELGRGTSFQIELPS